MKTNIIRIPFSYRPISGLMECAKDMIKEALPIKCLEALVLGTYLTNDIHGLLRFNISFKVGNHPVVPQLDFM